MIDAIKYNLGLRAQEGQLEVLDVEEPVVDSPAVVLAGKGVSNGGPTVPTVTGMSEEEEEDDVVVIAPRNPAPAVRRPLGWPAAMDASDAALLMGFSSVPSSSTAPPSTAESDVEGVVDPPPASSSAPSPSIAPPSTADSVVGGSVGEEEPALSSKSVVSGKAVKKAVASEGVKEDHHYPMILAWMELGPMGKNDPHFAIAPQAARNDPSLGGPDGKQRVKEEEVPGAAPRCTSRAEQRAQESARAVVGVSEALEQVAKTESVKVAEAMAHRETYAVSSRVHKQLLQEHKLNIQQKKELYEMADDPEEKAQARVAYSLALKLPVPKLEDTVAKVKSNACPPTTGENLTMPGTIYY